MATGSTPRWSAKAWRTSRRPTGRCGYINFGAIPKPTYDEEKKTVSMVIDIDEGKPFYVSRIEFQGNTITRDKVIRRELMLEEGQVYNSNLWEYSLLRLNQLEYFEPLKVDQDSEAHQDAEAGTVDLLLKVKEKGKNSIGLNGGMSGQSGAFLGVNYQTNNFLGLGETLSLQGNLGSISRQFTFGFSQPYVHNRPLNVGFQIYNSKQDFNAAKNYQAQTGAVRQPHAGAAIAGAELQPGFGWIDLLAAISAQAPCLPARGLYLFVEQIDDHRLQHRLADLLPDHRLPVGRARFRCAGRHRQQHGLVHVHLQHHQQPHAPAHRQGVHGGLADGRHLGQRALFRADGGLQAVPADALPDPLRQRAQCAGHPGAVGLHPRHWRLRGPAQQSLL